MGKKKTLATDDQADASAKKRRVLKKTTSEVAGERCIVCNQDVCACPHEILKLKHVPEAKHRGEYWMRLLWKKPDDAIDEDAPEEPHLYCSLCTQFLGKNNVKAARGNAVMSTGAGMRVTKSTGVDDIKAHVGNPKGNHHRAVDALTEQREKESQASAADGDAGAGGETLASKDQRSEARRPIVVPDGLMNLAVLCYAALMLPLSAQAFEKLARVVGLIGANLGVNQRYQTTYFFSELLLSLDVIIWESMICAFKAASQFTLHLDGADDYLLLRVVLISPSFMTTSMFWQARKMSGKCSEAVWQSVLKAFTVLQHSALDSWYTITEAEFLGKLCALVADGASELGVRYRGKMCEAAKPGANLFHKMQSRRDELVGESEPPLLGYWCASHRIDLAPAAADKKHSYTTTLLSFFRSLTGHIMFSGRARGILEFLAKALFDEGGVNEDSTSRSLASLYRAPTRWLSDAKPSRSFVSRISDFILYVRELEEEKKKVHKDLGAQWAVHLKDIRFYVVMPGISDMLQIVEDFNHKSQPGKTTMEDVSEQLQLCIDRLEDLCLRVKSEENGQRPCEFVKLIMDFHNNSHEREVPCNSSQLAKVLSKMEVQVRKDKGTQKTTRIAIYTVNYKVSGASKKHEVCMLVTPENMKEAIASLKVYGNELMADLSRRFVGTYITTDLMVLFAVDVDAKSKDFELPPPVVKRVAKFFKVEEAVYGAAVVKLQEQKSSIVDSVKEELWQKAGGPAKKLTLSDVWPKVLTMVQANATLQEQTWPAQWSLKLALVLKTSNAIVEGDASVKRLLKDVMTGHGKPHTVDCRMRLIRHGPKLSSKSLLTDELLVNGVKEFLLTDRYLNSSGQKSAPESLSEEHKAMLALAKRKPLEDPVADGPVTFKSAADHSVAGLTGDFELVTDALTTAGDSKAFDDMLDSLEASFAEDPSGSSLGLAVLAPPPKKTKKGTESKTAEAAAADHDDESEEEKDGEDDKSQG